MYYKLVQLSGEVAKSGSPILRLANFSTMDSAARLNGIAVDAHRKDRKGLWGGEKCRSLKKENERNCCVGETQSRRKNVINK